MIKRTKREFFAFSAALKSESNNLKRRFEKILSAPGCCDCDKNRGQTFCCESEHKVLYCHADNLSTSHVESSGQTGCTDEVEADYSPAAYA
ncbi:hypothetical protein [Cedecea davisae]|uniref:hypothetical protein n=1 Tax=Cedecea davisae TaxID=158484 RepID=UPI0024319A5B|nr:hypothetical protein [Cedecea davisae]